ncbi:MAG: UDP-N-acetylmuramoyl-L-alanine--D-glutamate ligase [Mycobacteriales bacterium]
MTQYDGLPVVVAGAGVSGTAAARVLADLGARVTVVDGNADALDVLAQQGFVVATELPDELGLVVTSPGWRPSSPLLVAAAARGVEVIGEVELAWRLRGPAAAPWLALTGTNGKTTTVKMLESVLRAAGHRAVAAGNVGLPLLDAVLAAEPYDVLAVELSSFQLHWSATVRPHAGAILNLADDHTDWHGSFQEYALAKARVFDADTSVGNVDDEVVRTLLNRARGRRVAFTLQSPRSGEVGVVEHLLVDRAFPDVPGEATELATVADVGLPGDHNVANALAAATLARSFGVPADAVREGLRSFTPEPHRNALVGVVDEVAWIDDSKATNPHAAAASLAGYAPVVWVAGGLLKGADVDELVRQAAPRLRAAVLLGTDRAALREALARHAPNLPVVEVARLDTGAMQEVVEAARSLAQPGDTVLLAPAAASMDCFRDYKERGDLFAAAVQALA